MSGPVVKICGVSSPEVARAAWRAGADYLGLVFAESRRQVSIDQAQEIVLRAPGKYVAVFRNMQDLDRLGRVVEAVKPAAIQFHGLGPVGWVAWTRQQGMLAVATYLATADADVWLLDGPQPGSGLAWRWQLPPSGGPYWLAGGLRPDNVAEAIARLQPDGVDVSSGVEQGGVKSVELIQRFIEEAKAWQR